MLHHSFLLASSYCICPTMRQTTMLALPIKVYLIDEGSDMNLYKRYKFCIEKYSKWGGVHSRSVIYWTIARCTSYRIHHEAISVAIHQLEDRNSMAPGRYDSNFISVIFEQILPIKFIGTSCEITLSWMPQNSFDDKSTLVQAMVWCRQPPMLTKFYVVIWRYKFTIS